MCPVSKNVWLLGEGVKSWTMKDFVDVVVVGARDAVAARATAGSAGVVNAVAAAAAAAAAAEAAAVR
jgi:hypothetical protein